MGVATERRQSLQRAEELERGEGTVHTWFSKMPAKTGFPFVFIF